MNLYNPTIVARAWKRVGLQHVSLVAGLALAAGGAFALSQPVLPENSLHHRQDTRAHYEQASSPRTLTEHLIYLVDSKERRENLEREEYWTMLEIAQIPGNELYQRSFAILNSSEPEEAKVIESLLTLGSHEMAENVYLVDWRNR